MKNFEELLGKENPMLGIIRDREFKNPSEIQEKSIPVILKGKDVIAGASTGSGKTLAFAAGLIKNVEKRCGIQGLVLTPTRELAEQIANELSKFSRHKGLDVISVYGGVSIHNQIKNLKTTDIVVGTPGRILDHITRNSINLTKVNTLVLDEADRMLDMGFREDVEKIISKCPKKRQTLFFSATISEEIVYLAQKYMRNPIEISAEPHVDPKKLKQVYYDVHDHLKYSLLNHLLKNEKAKLIMIFCNSRKNVDFITKNLQSVGLDALPLHGGYSQDKRRKILENFHSKDIHILVATDVAARGLDIKGVSHVYNYDIPPTQKEYIHRIGRTARAGKEGKVINVVASRDYENFNVIINGEFNIVQEKTPFVKKIEIKWMPERRQGRFSRGSFNKGRGNGQERSGGYRRTSGRGYDGQGERQNRFSRGRPGQREKSNGSSYRGQRGRDDRKDNRRPDRRRHTPHKKGFPRRR